MQTPSLAALTIHPRNDLTPAAPDGVYCLDTPDQIDPCKSSVIVIRNAIDFTREETQQLDDFMSQVPPSTNQWGKTIHRKEATFGVQYKKYNYIPPPEDTWPTAVQKVMVYVDQIIGKWVDNSSRKRFVHGNLYPHGASGVPPHADDESEMEKGMPIFSFTLLNGEIKPRPFTIYRPQTAEERAQELQTWELKVETNRQAGKSGPNKPEQKPVPIANIVLNHGDLLIMQGEMQSHFKHGVEPAKPKKAFEQARRMNLTVRTAKSTDLPTHDQKRLKASD
jgi:alkylated DNA repair dioxygenase AlkB